MQLLFNYFLSNYYFKLFYFITVFTIFIMFLLFFAGLLIAANPAPMARLRLLFAQLRNSSFQSSNNRSWANKSSVSLLNYKNIYYRNFRDFNFSVKDNLFELFYCIWINNNFMRLKELLLKASFVFCCKFEIREAGMQGHGVWCPCLKQIT